MVNSVIYNVMLYSKKSLNRLRATNKAAEVAFWLMRSGYNKKDIVRLMLEVEAGIKTPSQAILGV